ncbi:MAG: hypothetical protein JWP29_5495 [Rhodoferax sp.]|nr:hypothetical protein [Rhodoferax sp.]
MSAMHQLRQNLLQSGDASNLRPGQDPVIMVLRRKVIPLWLNMSPQAQLAQALQIPNGVVNAPVPQSQAMSNPMAMAPVNPTTAADLNNFLSDAEKLAANGTMNQLNQIGMRGGVMMQVRLNPLLSEGIV